MFKKRNSSKAKYSETTDETLKSLRKAINGYVDYETLSARRQTDQVFRRYLVDLTLELRSIYSSIQNQLMQGQILSAWSASNQILKFLDETKKILVEDVYRHSTFFDTPDVSANLEISVLYILESETILELNSIKENMNRVIQRLQNLDLLDIEKDIYKIKTDISEVYQTISDRAELIASYEIIAF